MIEVMINGCKHSVMPRLDFKGAVDRVVGMEVTGIIGWSGHFVSIGTK